MHFDLIVTLGAVFTSVALLTGALASMVLLNQAPARKRLRQISAPSPSRPSKVQLSDVPGPSVQRLAQVTGRSTRDISRLQQRLAAAGYDEAGAVGLYWAAQLILPLVFATVPLFILGLNRGWIAALTAAVLGVLIPDVVLTKKTTRHRRAIQDGLPDALDLIVVCMEAGSSLDQAILKASSELEIALPAIARELKTLSAETRAGKPRLDAFQALARRTGVEDVKALVAMLIQTDRFGTSIAQSLRTHAETSRTRRRQRAEERASTVGVKLVFPLVLCLLPALFVVCLGPVIANIHKSLF